MRARAGRLLAVHARGECKFRAPFPVASSPFDSPTRGVIIIQASPISSWHTPLILFPFLPHALLNLLIHIHPVFSHCSYFHWKNSHIDLWQQYYKYMNAKIWNLQKDFWTHEFCSYKFNQLLKQKGPEFIWFQKKEKFSWRKWNKF